jgi:hypothetical protein
VFNKEVIRIINECGFELDDILNYFVSLHYNLNPTYIPELVKKQANTTGILQRDYTKGTVIWTVPLFDSESSIPLISEDKKWEWVHTEYRKLFMDIKGIAGGDKKGCVTKMKKFFAENPETRKEQILIAAKMYTIDFANGTNNPKFMQRADYFISKVVKTEGGNSSQSRLSQYLELIDNETETKSTRDRNMRGIY